MGRESLIQKLLDARREIEPGQDATIGLFRPEDALGVALAYYEIYGDAFPLEHVYDPDEIACRNTTDDQYTLVARTPRGDVVGLAGLFRSAPNPDLYEAGQLMVLKSYRKRNIPARFSEEILDNLPRTLRIPVIFGEAVCNHLSSQSLCYAHGFAFTGLEAECMPSLTKTREGGEPRNLSLILMFKIFENATRETHTPRAYRAFCEGVYAELALPRVESPSEKPTGRTAVDQFYLQGAGLLRLTVTRLGEDFDEAVSAAEAKVGNPGVVQIFLNLGDAAVSFAVDALRDRGYFLGGLLPYWFGSDGLLMQKVRLEPDWDAILVCDPKGAAMRDLIREDYERATCREHGIA